MCLTKLYIPTRASYIYENHQTAMFNLVRCGKCAECQQDVKNEYLYRTYYEALDSLKRGCGIIFDTLTYNEDNVPWSKDVIKKYHGFEIPEHLNFRCFDYRDFSLFVKKVRKAISDRYGLKENFKYIVCSEYGNDDRYTHRPHYHIIFFLKNPKINPVEFSLLISQKWKLGLTDGVKDKGLAYFKTKRLFTDKTLAINNAVGYICKYITKDSDYSLKVKDKIKLICKWLDKNVDKKMRFDSSCYRYDLFIQSLKRSLNQFHKQSKGYGELALKYMDYDKLMDDGKVICPDSYKIVRKITLPMYYYRKMFQYKDYEWIKYHDYERGIVVNELKEVWKYNKLGEKYKQHSINRKIQILTDVLRIKMLNAGNSIEQEKKIKDNIDYLMAGRQLKDYAEYLVIYKQHHKVCNDFVWSLDNYVNHLFNKGNKLIIRTKKEDVEKYGYSHVVFPNFTNKEGDYILTFSNFIKICSVNEDSHEKFNGYDKIFVLFQKLDKINDKRKQNSFDLKEKMRKKFKKNKLLT